MKHTRKPFWASIWAVWSVVIALALTETVNARNARVKARPGAILGAEIARRNLASGSVVRVYVGGVLRAEIPAAGDTQITVGTGTVPVPPPPPPPPPPPNPPDPTPTPTPPPTPVPIPTPVPGQTWYVSPSGKSTNLGTAESPWDLEGTINGTRRATLASGGTVWLLPGTYRLPPAANREGLGYRCVVGGSPDRPLVFRAVPGQRVQIDGGWSFFAGSSNTWLWGVEVIVSDLKEGLPPFGMSGSWPPGAPNGGISAYTSESVKVINCVIHDNRQGLNLWTEARNPEAYGNIIYDNGWKGSDRAHGHGIYTQCPPGNSQLIENNILTQWKKRNYPDGRYGLHGYGERVAVTNITLKGNLGAQSNDAWLLDDGAVLGPSRGHQVLENAVYGVRFRLGSRPDQPLEFRSNVVAGALEMSTGPEVTKIGNLITPPEPRPSNDQVILKPNRYEPARAHLMLIDWDRSSRVKVDTSVWLSAGERVRIYEPWQFAENVPLFSGAWPAGGIELPVEGARVLVAVKESIPAALPPASVASRIEEAPVSPRLKR